MQWRNCSPAQSKVELISPTLTEWSLLMRGRKLLGSRRKVMSKLFRNLFMPFSRPWGLDKKVEYEITNTGDTTLTHWGLVMPYGAWWHQAITWSNVDLSSVRSSQDIHLKASSQEILQSSISEIIWKIKYLKYHSNFPGANELITMSF